MGLEKIAASLVLVVLCACGGGASGGAGGASGGQGGSNGGADPGGSHPGGSDPGGSNPGGSNQGGSTGDVGGSGGAAPVSCDMLTEHPGPGVSQCDVRLDPIHGTETCHNDCYDGFAGDYRTECTGSTCSCLYIGADGPITTVCTCDFGSIVCGGTESCCPGPWNGKPWN